uniref:ORF52 n=1 Tax=Human herpesvirus 3 TaxID=10335 RepID=A0A4D6F738_HHV3|nr:ORF52 [Human alphaherpesvirus 3]
MDATQITLVRESGHICAASIYTSWTQSGQLTQNGLSVLYYLLCKNSCGKYVPKFAEITVQQEDLCRYSRHGGSVSAATFASICRAASSAALDAWPLEPLGNADTWRCLHGTALATLRRVLGFKSFYSPVTFETDANTGLLLKTIPDEHALNNDNTPSTGVLRANFPVAIDVSAVSACNAHTQGTSLAYARLTALKSNGDTQQQTPLDVEVITPKAYIRRKYKSTFSPPIEREGQTSDLFNLEERRLVLSGNRAIVVRVLLPCYFDCLTTDSTVTSSLSILATYRLWYAAAFGKPGVVRPIFAYLGPELNPKGEDRDYFCTVGFPGWTTLRTQTPAVESIRTATEMYMETDGLWPVTGIQAFHYLAPWGQHPPLPPRVQDLIGQIPQDTGHADATVNWDAGRISTVFKQPVQLQDRWMAKFDFSAFFPTIYCAMFPMHFRLGKIVLARMRRGMGCLKPALVSFFGGLRHILPSIYKAIIFIANEISLCVEQTALEQGFAICTYIKDGFWGIFADLHTRNVCSDQARCSALNLAAACERAVTGLLRIQLGLNFTPAMEPVLRVEGVYTHAFTWCTTGSWLWNLQTNTPPDLVGVPWRSQAARDLKERLSGLLCTATKIREQIQENCIWDHVLYDIWAGQVVEAARKTYVDFFEHVFDRRYTPVYWSLQEQNSETKAIPASYLTYGHMQDKDYKPRQIIMVRNPNPHGPPTVVYWELLPSCACIPPIDCAAHLKPLIHTFVTIINHLLDAHNDFSSPSLKFTDDPLASYNFLFL